jgi:hypothetical protein
MFKHFKPAFAISNVQKITYVSFDFQHPVGIDFATKGNPGHQYIDRIVTDRDDSTETSSVFYALEGTVLEMFEKIMQSGNVSFRGVVKYD